MKKITKYNLILIINLILTLILISNVFGYSEENFKPKYGITTANVNFRKFANTEYSSILKTLAKNTRLKIVGQTNGFYIVELTSSEVGAVSKDYIRLEGTSLNEAKVYENLKKYRAKINVTRAIVRGGPSTSYKIYYQLIKDAEVEVIGRIDNFSMIVSKNNLIGMIRSDLITKINESPNAVTNNNSNVTPNNTPIIDNINQETNLKNELYNLINDARKNSGINLLSKDNSLYNAAQIKSDDMVKNNYFAHESATYGSPFKLMQDLGISYITAGENIAGNSDIKAAFDSWINSDTHKQNILSSNYNYVGIGITKSKTYGYVICTMFIGK